MNPAEIAETTRLLAEVKAGLTSFAFGPGASIVRRLADALKAKEAELTEYGQIVDDLHKSRDAFGAEVSTIRDEAALAELIEATLADTLITGAICGETIARALIAANAIRFGAGE